MSSRQHLFRRVISRGTNMRWEYERWAYPVSVIDGTILERIVCKQVKDMGYDFEWQYKVTNVPMVRAPKCDVLVRNAPAAPLLDIECQGEYWHQDTARDQFRRQQIELAGIKIVYVWERDILSTFEVMRGVIEDALRGIERPRP